MKLLSVRLLSVGMFYISISLLTSYSAFSQSYVYAKRFGSIGLDVGISITTDAAGNNYVTGFFSGTVDFDPGAGIANLSSAGGDDIFFAKYDSQGNYIYAKRIGSASDDAGNNIVVDASGNCYITGYYWGPADFDPGAGVANLTPVGVDDIFFAKYDPNGNYVYAKSIGSTGNDIGYGIAVDVSGNCYITGFFQGIADFNPGAGTANLQPINGNAGIYFAKYNASGNYVYAKSIGTSIAGMGHGIGLDATGNCYITGTYWGVGDFDPGAGTANLTSMSSWSVYLAKYDGTGNYLWANSICIASGNNNYSIATTPAGNCYLTGSYNAVSDFDPGAGTVTLTPAGADDIYFAQYDQNGNYVFAKSIGSVNSDAGSTIVADANGNCYLTGWFEGTVDFDPDATGTINLSAVGMRDIFFAGYDVSGNYAFGKSIGSTGSDYGSGIAADNNGTIYLTGNFNNTADFDPDAGITNLTSAGSGDIFIAKYGSCSAATPAITPATATTFCLGDSVILQSSTANTYLWSNSETTQNITVTTPGNYYVVITDANNCTASSLPLTITVNATPTLTINTSGPTTFCMGDSLVLTAAATGSINMQSVDQSQLVYNGGTSARNLPGYSHWQSFTAGITGTLSQIDLGFFTLINATGTLNIFSGTGTGGTLLQSQIVTVICSGGNCTIPFAVSAPVIAGQVYTYQFIPGPAMPDPYGVQVQVPGTYPGGEMALVDPSGTYMTGFDMVFQTYVTTGSGLTYLWSNGSVDSTIVVNNSGTYTVTVTNSNGCSTVDSIQVNVTPATAVNIGQDTTICLGSNLLLDAGSGFATYLWNDGSSAATFTVDTDGVYFVQVTNISGCSATDSIIITTTNCAPAVAFYSSDSSFCEKKCIDFYDLSTNNPISWQWFFPGADSLTSTLQNPTNICYNSYGSFDVTLIACNTFSCDTLVLTNFINEYQSPSDSIYQSNDTLYSMPGYSYQWYESSIGLLPGENNQYYLPLVTGSYFCIVTNAIGCLAISNVITITGISENDLDKSQFTIYPNPNDGIFTIYKNNICNGSLIVTILDYSGRKIRVKEINQTGGTVNEKIYIPDLVKGFYTIELKNAASTYYSKIIVK